MFDIQTDEPDQLKRIATAGAGALLVGLVIVTLNLLGPLVTGEGYGSTDVVFGLFGVIVVVLAARPTYQAAEKLDES
jgi:Na+/melibiose symporter-like transporter